MLRPPAELAWLTDCVGAEKALALIEAAGGTAVYVSRTPTEDCPLARMVGLPAAQALAEQYGGEEVRVPLCRVWRARLYRQRGDTVVAIARKLGTLDTTVYRMLRGASDDRQIALPLPVPLATARVNGDRQRA